MKLKLFFLKILPELFYFLSIGAMMLIALEIIKEGIVIAYLPLNFWLIAWCISGIMVIYMKQNL